MKNVYLLLILVASFKMVSAQNLSGVVTNNECKAVAGAFVKLLNTNYSAVTNETGSFQFNNAPAGSYLLQVSSVGYTTTTLKVKVDKGFNQSIKVQLLPANRQLDEVTVTAQKREELLQDVPASVSSLSAKQVQDYRIWNLKDLTAIAPNLYAANPGDNRNVTSIRGITTTSYDPAISTYIDDVNQFSLDTYIPQLFDVARIEILRGPQSTLYGRNAMGGVINVITTQPTNDVTGFAEADLGNYKLQRYNAGIRFPLIKNKLFFGAAGQYNGFGGFYTNAFNNTRLDKQHSFLGNYYLKYLATPTLAITLNLKNYANRNNGPFALSGSPQDAITAPFRVDQNATTKMIDNIINSSLSFNYKGKKINFISSSAYQKNYRYYTVPIDGDFSPLDAVSIINNYGNKFNKVEVATQEFRLSSPASLSRFNWSAGVYGFYRYSPSKTGTRYGQDAAALGAPPNLTSINTNTERNYGASAFGQLTYTVSTKVDITVGLRYDRERRKSTIKGEFQPDGSEVMLSRPDTAASATFNAFSPKINLLYHAGQANTIYASYSKGFRAGGLSQLSSDPSQPPLVPYQPEFSHNFELGSKNVLLDNRLRINLTLFLTRVNNAQVPTLILPDAITVIRNTGKLNTQGAELELEANAFKGLDVVYNFGYTHARYNSLLLPSNGTAVDLKNNWQVFTPNVTSMLALQYNHDLDRANTKLIVRAGWRLIGKQYFDLANQIKQDPYSVFDSRIGVKTTAIDVFLWAGNIFNKRYIDYAYDFGASHLGNPRTYGVTLRKEF